MNDRLRKDLDVRTKALADMEKVAEVLESNNIDLTKNNIDVILYDTTLVLCPHGEKSMDSIIMILESLFSINLRYRQVFCSGNQVIFVWEPEEKSVIRVWGHFPADNVPEDLLDGCEVQQFERTVTENRIVCDCADCAL